MVEISTYYAVGNEGKAVVSRKNDMYIIDYYDNKNTHFFNEEYPNETLEKVELFAEDWALGYKQLEDVA